MADKMFLRVEDVAEEMGVSISENCSQSVKRTV